MYRLIIHFLIEIIAISLLVQTVGFLLDIPPHVDPYLPVYVLIGLYFALLVTVYNTCSIVQQIKKMV